MTNPKLTSWLSKDIVGGKVGAKDLIFISRQLATMIRAGVPVIQALRMMLRQAKKSKLRSLITSLVVEVEGGNSLSFAMSKHPKVFNTFFLGVLRSGEASGRLSGALDSLATYQEQSYNFTRKIQTALTYPLLILITIIIVIVLIFVFIMPQLIKLFADANVDLPLPTIIVVGVAVFFQKYWYVVLTLMIVLGLLARSYLKTPEGRFTLSTYVLRIPVVRALFSKIYLARLTSVLHTLFDSDVPIIESLRLARESMGNRVYQKIMDDTIKGVQDGISISAIWDNEPYIPSLLTALVNVGERSGKITTSLQEAQRFFQREVDDALNTISVLLEPLMIIVLGIGVAIIVAAVLLPIYNLVLVL